MNKNILDRKIKIAIAGCGRISKNHFEAIDIHKDNLELVGICDTNNSTLETYQKKYNAPGYNKFNDMLNALNIDIISICTPSGTHPAQTILAAQKGINVMTEKPMATRWKDGLAMVKACDEAGVNLFVIKQNRSNSTLQLLKRAIEEKRFGKIHMVSMNVFWTRPQEYYDSAKWRGTWELDGGALMNQASHYIDLLDWLIGPIDSIQAMTGTQSRDIEVEDSGVMNVRWRNGALGSVSVTMLTYPKNYEGSITILGSEGSAKIGGVAVNKIEHWKFNDKKDYDDQLETTSYETTSVYGFGHPLYYKNVIEVLRGNADPETDGREGLKSLEVIIAAYLSARDNKTISLPLEY